MFLRNCAMLKMQGIKNIKNCFTVYFKSLVKVIDDLRINTEKKQFLFDLSAALDTEDHKIVLCRLQHNTRLVCLASFFKVQNVKTHTHVYICV